MRNPLFESICFCGLDGHGADHGLSPSRSDERFGIMMAFATVSVSVAVVILAIAFFRVQRGDERPPPDARPRSKTNLSSHRLPRGAFFMRFLRIANLLRIYE